MARCRASFASYTDCLRLRQMLQCLATTVPCEGILSRQHPFNNVTEHILIQKYTNKLACCCTLSV